MMEMNCSWPATDRGPGCLKCATCASTSNGCPTLLSHSFWSDSPFSLKANHYTKPPLPLPLMEPCFKAGGA